MSLQDNIVAFVNVLGMENADIVFPFANIQWESDADRNKFISQIININGNQKIGKE
jgi:hypothetical protein